MGLPLGPLAALAAAAAGYWYYEKHKAPAYVPGSPGGVSELQKGQMYAVLVSITGSPSTSVKDTSDMIKSYFESCGFTVYMSPIPRSQADEAKFAAHQPGSTWIFNARWEKDEKNVSGPANPMIGMASFTPMPVK
jgi:hypothetical protein